VGRVARSQTLPATSEASDLRAGRSSASGTEKVGAMGMSRTAVLSQEPACLAWARPGEGRRGPGGETFRGVEGRPTVAGAARSRERTRAALRHGWGGRLAAAGAVRTAGGGRREQRCEWQWPKAPGLTLGKHPLSRKSY